MTRPKKKYMERYISTKHFEPENITTLFSSPPPKRKKAADLMWTSHYVQLTPDSTEVGQSSHTIEPLSLKANSMDICFLSQQQLKLSFLRWLWWDPANSHQLPLWKGKPIYLPSWCPHYYPAIPPGSDRTRARSQGSPSEKPNLSFSIQCPLWWIHRGLHHIKPHNGPAHVAFTLELVSRCC